MNKRMPSVARVTPTHWLRPTDSTPPSRRNSSEKSGTVVSSNVEASAEVRSSPSVKPSW